jgi:hypothetical protein
MVAVARPITGPEDEIGNVPQTGTGRFRIERLQREQLANEVAGAATPAQAQVERCDGGELGLEPSVGLDIEMQRYRARGERTFDDVEPEKRVAATTCGMFEGGTAHEPRYARSEIHHVGIAPARRDRTHRKDARIDNRCP